VADIEHPVEAFSLRKKHCWRIERSSGDKIPTPKIGAARGRRQNDEILGIESELLECSTAPDPI
jgi:hypothetical protein